jgi:hypothetical protein
MQLCYWTVLWNYKRVGRVKCQKTSLKKLLRHTYLLLSLSGKFDATNRTNGKNIIVEMWLHRTKIGYWMTDYKCAICKLKLGKICINATTLFVCSWRDSLQRTRASLFTRFLDHTQPRTTVGRTPLDEWSVRSRELYLTTHITQNRKISITPVGFEPTISAGDRPQTYALDRAVAVTGYVTNKTAKRN